MIDKIHYMVLENRQLKKHDINEILKILTSRVFHILYECSLMRKLSARWLPLLLTLDQTRCRVTSLKVRVLHEGA